MAWHRTSLRWINVGLGQLGLHNQDTVNPVIMIYADQKKKQQHRSLDAQY